MATRNDKKFDNAAFQQYLAERTTDHVGFRYDKANDAKLIGFAMLLTQLTIMRNMAQRKALTPADIQACIDAAMQEGKIDCKRTNTGQEIFIHEGSK
jgi:hypothetical protein